jgi:hypothetical protein
MGTQQQLKDRRKIKLVYTEFKDTGKIGTYQIDFDELINCSFGFGLERFDETQEARKSVQQTLSSKYVDSWGLAHEVITLAGSIEMPEGRTSEILKVFIPSSLPPFMKEHPRQTTIQEIKKPAREKWSFYDAISFIYEHSNSPYYVRYGSNVLLFDTMLNRTHVVTIKSFSLNVSIDNPAIMPWSIVLFSTEKTGQHWRVNEQGAPLELSVRQF